MNVWGAFLGSIIRWALAAVFGGLVVRGIVSQETLDGVLGQANLIATTVLGLVVPLLWSFWQKIIAKVRERVALETAPTASEGTVSRKTSEIPLPSKVAVAFGKERP